MTVRELREALEGVPDDAEVNMICAEPEYHEKSTISADSDDNGQLFYIFV